MNVFFYSDYRAVLKDLVKERKQFDKNFGFHILADAARIQRPYLSKVIKGTAQLSSDQLFLITRCLNLGTEEQEFLQLLLEHDRTAVVERRQHLAERIRAMSELHLDPSVQLPVKSLNIMHEGEGGAADYYLDPMIQIIHIALSVEAYSRNPMILTKEWNISGAHLHTALASLEKMGLAYRDGSRWLPCNLSLHLAKTSPLYRAWRNQIKFLGIQRLNQLGEHEVYSYTTVFSANAATRKAINDRFLSFLKSCESAVREAPAQQVYQLSFDLFPWTKSL